MKNELFKAAYREVFNKVPTEQRAAFLSAGPSHIMGVNCNTLLEFANELIADGTNFYAFVNHIVFGDVNVAPQSNVTS